MSKSYKLKKKKNQKIDLCGRSLGKAIGHYCKWMHSFLVGWWEYPAQIVVQFERNTVIHSISRPMGGFYEWQTVPS